MFSNLCKQLFDFSWTSCERWIWLLQHFCMQIFMRASCDVVRSIFLGLCNCRNLAYLCYLPSLKTEDVILLLAHICLLPQKKLDIPLFANQYICFNLLYSMCSNSPPKRTSQGWKYPKQHARRHIMTKKLKIYCLQRGTIKRNCFIIPLSTEASKYWQLHCNI